MSTGSSEDIPGPLDRFRQTARFRRGIVKTVVSAEEIAFLRGHPTCVLLEMLGDLEVYILYATEQKWFSELPDKELRVSVIKSEMAMRGAFD